MDFTQSAVLQPQWGMMLDAGPIDIIHAAFVENPVRPSTRAPRIELRAVSSSMVPDEVSFSACGWHKAVRRDARSTSISC
jgi:hypothetical protein